MWTSPSKTNVARALRKWVGALGWFRACGRHHAGLPASAPRRAGGRTAGAALSHARKAKERTYPELQQSARCKLVVLALELGGRWGAEAVAFVRLLARLRARAPALGPSPPPPTGPAFPPVPPTGRPCCQSRPPAPSQLASSPCLFPARPMLMARPRCSATSWLTPPTPRPSQAICPRPVGVHWDPEDYAGGGEHGSQHSHPAHAGV